MRGDSVEVEVFSEDDNTRAVLEHVPCGAMHRLDGMGLGGMVGSCGRRWGRGRNGLGYISKEFEHVLERIRIVLGRVDIVR